MASKRETQKFKHWKSESFDSAPPARYRDTERARGSPANQCYFMLSDPVRTVLNTALEKYRSGQSEPILVGGENLLKPALRLMTWYRLVIERVFKMTLDWRTDDAASDTLAQSLKGPPYDQKWLTN